MGKRQDGQTPISGERREKGNLYEEVTARIVAELEQGRVPWVQPWGKAKATLGLPRNGLSGQRYSVHGTTSELDLSNSDQAELIGA